MSTLAIEDRLAAARERLAVKTPVERAGPALAAALLAAITALTLAGAVVLGPGVETGPVATPAVALEPGS